MIDGFVVQVIEVRGVSLSVHISGTGPALLLLHGYPQNHCTWRKVAPTLAESFTCVVPDLRGYGESSVPEADAAHEHYSKRAMALDMLALMQRLGYTEFYVLGHDRGARVAYRLALDSEAVLKLGIIDVVPTGDMWSEFDADMALKAYHWTFLAQPYPLPETLINANPDYYLEHTLKSWTGDQTLDAFDQVAMESYLTQMREPARVRAMCEDYRAGATIDRELDKQDKGADQKITSPVFFMWSEDGFPAGTGDPMARWRVWADRVDGVHIQSGHFAQEENPGAVIDAFVPFFSST